MLAPQDQFEIQTILTAAKAKTPTKEAIRLINEAIYNRRAAVMELFAANDFEACSFIIKHGGSFNDLVLAAASNGNIKALDFFIRQAKSANHYVDFLSVLHLAAKNNQGSVIGHVLRSYTDNDFDLVWAACGAALGGHFSLMNRLLAHEQRKNNRILNQKDYRRVAQYAAEAHHVDVSYSLLNLAGDVSAADYIYVADGAAKSGDLKFVNSLLANVPSILPYNYNQLSNSAAGYGHSRLAIYLLEKISDPKQRHYDDAVAVALRKRHFDCANDIKLAKQKAIKPKPAILEQYTMKANISRAASSSAPETFSLRSRVAPAALEVIALKKKIADMELELQRTRAQVQELESTNVLLEQKLAAPAKSPLLIKRR